MNIGYSYVYVATYMGGTRELQENYVNYFYTWLYTYTHALPMCRFTLRTYVGELISQYDTTMEQCIDILVLATDG